MRKLSCFILLLAVTISPAFGRPTSNPVVAKTSSYIIQTSDSGTIFTNDGATTQVVFTLPTPDADAELEYQFVIVTGQYVRVSVGNSSTQQIIYEQGGSSVGLGTVGLRHDGIGSTLRIVAVNDTTWAVMHPVQDNSWESL